MKAIKTQRSNTLWTVVFTGWQENPRRNGGAPDLDARHMRAACQNGQVGAVRDDAAGELEPQHLSEVLQEAHRACSLGACACVRSVCQIMPKLGEKVTEEMEIKKSEDAKQSG